MSQRFDGAGETDLIISGREMNESILLLVLNEHWSVKEGNAYQLSVNLDGQNFEMEGLGIREHTKRGFLMYPSGDFLDAFSLAKVMTIKREAVIVDELSLQGSLSAWRRFARCMVNARTPVKPDPQPPSKYPLDPFSE